MKVSEMIIGEKYKSTAFSGRVKLIAVDGVAADGTGKVTVEYRGRLYTDCTFRMSK